LAELEADAELRPGLVQGLLPRLEQFLEPFTERLQRSEQRDNAEKYVAGLLSSVRRKNVESIAYVHDEDRMPMQRFIGQAPWDHCPLVDELARQIGIELGEANGVLVFDPSGFAKYGKESVGVQRQWCGRLGKVENCQVGIYLGYVTHREHALVDMRLYLPESWAKDKKRRRKVGVPKEIRFQTRHQLALEMLDQKGALLPHAWISGDDEMGRPMWFRQALEQRKERYLLAVPSNTLIRDLDAIPPPYRGHGKRPQTPFVRVDGWAQALPARAWTRIEIRAGEKEPLVMHVTVASVEAKTDRRRVGPKETLVIVRRQLTDGSWQHDYCLSNAPAETPRAEFARVANAEHRIEECIKRAKGEAGLADYEVRTWEGWHHHQTLALIATWFLVKETRRGKKMDTCFDGTPTRRDHKQVIAS
jgi:SRSO17 transposase